MTDLMAFADRKQIESYVESTLREAIPDGWISERSNPARLWWTIKRTSIPSGEWDLQDYHLHVSEDLQWYSDLREQRHRSLFAPSRAATCEGDLCEFVGKVFPFRLRSIHPRRV